MAIDNHDEAPPPLDPTVRVSALTELRMDHETLALRVEALARKLDHTISCHEELVSRVTRTAKAADERTASLNIRMDNHSDRLHLLEMPLPEDPLAMGSPKSPWERKGDVAVTESPFDIVTHAGQVLAHARCATKLAAEICAPSATEKEIAASAMALALVTSNLTQEVGIVLAKARI
jgi:hypothetical protein